MSERIAFLEGKIADLTAEKEKGVSISRLEVIEKELSVHEAELQEIKDAELAQEQATAQQVRIEEATAQAAYFLDNLVIEGFTMRELCVDEPQYQILRIAVQNKIINLAEENSRTISEIQADATTQRNELKSEIVKLQAAVEEDSKLAFEDHETIKRLRTDLHQSNLDRDDFESKLKNAGAEIDRLNSQVDDLRKEIAVGARNAYKVSDVEQTQQLKQFADQIKAARIHVYDVVPDNGINPKNYSAKRVDNGEEVNYNWTQAKNYIVVTDPAEVERFREQFANKEAVSDSSLGNETPVDVTTEVPFLELPRAEAPSLPAQPNTVDQGQQNGEVPATNAGQGQTVEERLSALEAHVFGYVKQAVA